MKEDQGAQIQFRRGGVASTFASFWLGTITFLVSLLFGAVPESFAQDVISQEEPTPSSVDEITTPIERSFLEGIRRPGFLPLAQGTIERHPGFFSRYQARPQSAQLLLPARQIRRRASARPGRLAARSRTSPAGCSIEFRSARLSIGPTGSTVRRIRTARCCSSRVSMVTACWASSMARVKLFEDHIVNLYRYEYNTPFIGKNDIRMTPNTFEGYTLHRIVRRQRRRAGIPLRRRLYHQDQRARTRTTSFGCRATPAPT